MASDEESDRVTEKVTQEREKVNVPERARVRGSET